MPKKPRKMKAGAGGGEGRLEKAAMTRKRGGGKVKMSGYRCGGKVMTKRGYGAARKG